MACLVASSVSCDGLQAANGLLWARTVAGDWMGVGVYVGFIAHRWWLLTGIK